MNSPNVTMNNVHEITRVFEEKLCEYTGSKFCCALDNCCNAIYLALCYEKLTCKSDTIELLSHTYVGVPCEVLKSNFKIKWIDSPKLLKGAYQLSPTRVYDSALRFTSNMYVPNTFMCLSFTGPYKHLKLSKGGAILTDDENAYKWFKRARFSGRNECSYHDDNFDFIGGNYYMMPEIATRGILLLQQFYNLDGTPKNNEDLELPYPDLSKFPIFTKATKIGSINDQ